MLLERRGISGAIDDGTVDVIEIVSSDITVVLSVVCDAKYAIKKFQRSALRCLLDHKNTTKTLPEALPDPRLTLAKTENSDDDKLFDVGDCSPSLVLSN